MKHIISVFLLVMSMLSCVAQKNLNYSSDYKKAKQLLENYAYSDAMALFLKLSPESPKNDYFKDASFLYAVTAIKNKQYDEALQMLKQIEIKYPDFEKEEVNYHIAVSYFNIREYDKALKYCSKIENKNSENTLKNLKYNFIGQYKDTDRLIELQERNSKDVDVATILYNKLLQKQQLTITEEGKTSQLQSLLGIKSDDSNTGIKHVGILLPYMSLGANSAKNTLFYDFHAGLQMGFDSLNKESEKLKLHYFSSEKDTASFLTFINSPDYKNLDLIIGPVYNNMASIAFEFNTFNKHTVFLNPFSNYIKNGSQNKQVIFNYPLAETLGSKTAEMCLSEFYTKNAIVFFGATKKDSSIALAFKASYEKAKGKIMTFKATTKYNQENIHKFIADKNKDSVGVIVVFSSDPLVATSVLTALEVHKCKAPIVAPKEWLEINSLTLKKYKEHHTNFIFQNYYSIEDEKIKDFNTKYFKINNLYPSEYSYVGYDMALFFGKKMIEYGDKFIEKLKLEAGSYDYLLQGYNYQNSNNNQAVQFVKFEDNKLVPIINYKK